MEIVVAGPNRIEDLDYGPVLRIGDATRTIEIVKREIVDAPRKQMPEGLSQTISIGAINHVYAEHEGQRRGPAAVGARIATRRADWHPFAGPLGSLPKEVNLAAKHAQDTKAEPTP
jgi:hypothetical protein